MATKKNLGSKATKSLFATIKEKGYSVSTAKTPLWEEGDTLAEGISEFDMYISQQYENSSFVIIREGDESLAVSFSKGEIDVEDYATINDKGLVDKKDVEFTITIKEVIALRDDEELGIKEGDTKLKAFVD